MTSHMIGFADDDTEKPFTDTEKQVAAQLTCAVVEIDLHGEHKGVGRGCSEEYVEKIYKRMLGRVRSS